jgi:hypothetical protein
MPFPNLKQFAFELRTLPWLHRLHIHGIGRTQEQRAAFFRALLLDTPEARLPTLQWRDFVLSGLIFDDELAPMFAIATTPPSRSLRMHPF